MEITFRHKETGVTVTLKELFEMIEARGSRAEMIVSGKVDPIERNYNPFAYEFKKIKVKQYSVMEIPFSSDFELVKGEHEFDQRDCIDILYNLKDCGVKRKVYYRAQELGGNISENIRRRY